MTVQANTEISPDIRVVYWSERVKLRDELETTVHIVRYDRDKVRLKTVLFDEETPMIDWCEQHGYTEAINGGFFLRSRGTPLGDVWVEGQQKDHEPFGAGWAKHRGSIHVDTDGFITIAPRHKLPERIDGSLFEIGPTLVHQEVSMFLIGNDPEGFSDTAYQHDDDINYIRHPRAAIGVNDEYIWTVTVDGRSVNDAGMFLDELAEVFLELGASEAVNLDGGSSSTHITGGTVVNTPRRNDAESARGFPVRNGIVFALR
jgi:exopolysaccharide biosynthesis protein